MTEKEADLSRVRTIPIGERPNKVRSEAFASPRADDATFAAFYASLPDILKARDFRTVVEAVVAAKRKNKAVILMVGGHVVKTGTGPLIVDMMRRGIVTHLAMNGSAAIHDYEIARFGETSEDVGRGVRDGTFGMVHETGQEMNDAFTAGMKNEWGMGEAVARALDAASDRLVHPEMSVLLNAWRLGVSTSVHAAIGAEIIHQHPAASGAAIGDTSHRDFRRFASAIEGLDDGGVVLNIGSAVIMPEVFLKALTIARNLNDGRPSRFVTCDFDMQLHYRPQLNVVQRPTAGGGAGYSITGHHELMIPLLSWAVIGRLSEPA